MLVMVFAFGSCDLNEDLNSTSTEFQATETVVISSTVPTLVDPWQSGNATFECGQVACCDADFHYKFDNWEGPTYEGSYPVDGGNIITITNDDGYSFDWTSVWPVSCLIVKGGTVANVYCYSTPQYSGTGVTTPTNPNSGKPYGISHATFCYNEPDKCYKEETAWAAGTRYVTKGNWATYVAYYGAAKTVKLYAGQTIEVGTATFSAPVNGMVTIKINLTGAIFSYDKADPLYDNNLKVQDYATTPPKSNPAPGLFAWKTRIEPGSTTGSITVPVNKFYGVHLDVGVVVPCK